MWKKILWNFIKPLIPFIIKAIGDAINKGDDLEEAAKKAFFDN